MSKFLLIIAVILLSLGLSVDTFLSRFAKLKGWVTGLFTKTPPAP